METMVRAAVDAAALKSLARRSDAIGLAHLAGHLALIGATGWLVVWARPTVGAWPAMAALGVVLVALFAPLHETTHRTPFRSLALNRVVGWAAGLVLVLPPEWFRLFHLAHHRHAQDPTRDPEIAGSPGLTPAGYAWRLTGVPYWVAQIRTLLCHAFLHPEATYIPAASRPAVRREARAYVFAYVVLAIGSVALRSDWLAWLYVVPVLLGQPVLRAVLMAEHTGLPRTADRMANTRTTLAGRGVAWLFWNANFHAEHHYAPGVPFHALPKLHALLRPALQSVSPGYAAAHRDIRRHAVVVPDA